ncbi:MAG TPA: hypothetical protein VHM30_13330 [Gemmatimonadaceae bacterium]|nr:hypothetical protein [Gemmatimonadaceae bacterium]
MILAAALALVLGWITMGDPQVRLANTILDDNPVVFAHYLAEPARYAGEALSTYGRVFASTTIQNWLPALALRTAGIDPNAFAIAFVLLQHALLGAALFAFARRVTNGRLTAWATVLFAFAALPWQWNLALYQSIMAWPYPGHLAVPFLLWSALALLDRRDGRLVAALAVAALIHPSMALCMVAIAGAFLLLSARAGGGRGVARTLAALAIPVAIAVVPPLWVGGAAGDRLATADLLAALRANGHLNPFASTRLWGNVVPTLVGYAMLALLAWRARLVADAPGRRLWIAASAATAALSAVHIVAMVVGIPRVAQLVGTRATLIWVLLTLPVVMRYLVDRALSESLVVRVSACALLILLGLQQFGLYLGPLLALLVAEWNGRPRVRLSAGLLLAWGALVIGAAAYGVLGGAGRSGRPLLAVLAPGTYLGVQAFAIAIPLLLLVALTAAPVSRWSRARHLVLPSALAALAALQAWRTGRETAAPLAVANRDAQLWARTDTPARDIFLVAVPDLPWRTLSERPTIRMAPDGFYVYSGSRTAKERFADQPRKLLADHPAGGAEAVAAFVGAYGARFIVAEPGMDLPWPVAYQNGELAIHSVSETRTSGVVPTR